MRSVSHRRRFLYARLAVSVGLLVALAHGLDWTSLRLRLSHADPLYFALAVAFGILANLVSAWRWQRIAERLRLAASMRMFVIAYGKGVTLNTLLPGATLSGDAYRAYALHRQGHSLLAAAASVAIDRLAGLWALFLLSACAWLLLIFASPDVPPASIHLHLLLLGSALVLPFLANALAHQLSPPRQLWLARLLRLLVETARFIRTTLVSSLVVQLLTIAALAAAFLAIAFEPPWLYLCALAGPVFFAAALPVSIGGYGTREAALAAYFALAGLPAEAAFAGGLLAGLAVTAQGALWAPAFLLPGKDAPAR